MFFQKKIEQAEKGIREINMTPLIDVSLVLVVMLLLATPLAFHSSIAVRKSEASARAAEKKMKTERIELRITSEDEILVNRFPVTRAKLSVKLRPLLEASAHRQVVIVCAPDVSHGAFVDVLDQAKLCGAADISVTGK
jgi:biopolymer transport protein ExbD